MLSAKDEWISSGYMKSDSTKFGLGSALNQLSADGFDTDRWLAAVSKQQEKGALSSDNIKVSKIESTEEKGNADKYRLVFSNTAFDQIDNVYMRTKVVLPSNEEIGIIDPIATVNPESLIGEYPDDIYLSVMFNAGEDKNYISALQSADACVLDIFDDSKIAFAAEGFFDKDGTDGMTALFFADSKGIRAAVPP